VNHNPIIEYFIFLS